MTSRVTEPQQTGEEQFPFDKFDFHEQIQKEIDPVLSQFNWVIQSYVWFNLLFITVGVVECLCFFVFFAFLAKSSMLAFSFAIIFLTAFSYFMLRLYFKASKREKLAEFCEAFTGRCRRLVRYQDGIPEHHLALATATTQFAARLQDLEYRYYAPPKLLKVSGPAMEKLSCWWHWYDIHLMRELLLHSSIDEHLKLVVCEPTNLEVHAALANAYVLFSGLYAEPKQSDGDEQERWIPPERFSEEMKRKFRLSAERAIEEFKILNHYAPDDPWVHAQLAYSYHDLQMPEEEIQEYEMILQLRPDDRETLFKLGMLYFQQGQNAEGLRIYEALKRGHYKKAENLIKFYGSYTPLQTTVEV